MTENRGQMTHLRVQSAGPTNRVEDSEFPSAFCHLSSVIGKLIFETLNRVI